MYKYHINYRDETTVNLLKELGEITWRSRVLNMLFFIPNKSTDLVVAQSLSGVLFIAPHCGGHKK